MGISQFFQKGYASKVCVAVASTPEVLPDVALRKEGWECHLEGGICSVDSKTLVEPMKRLLDLQ